MILVTGASGNVGGAMVPRLLAAGAKVRVLVRDAKKVQHLPAQVERATGDLGAPATLDAAMRGVKSLFLVTTEHGSDGQMTNAAAAAKRAGVAHIVFLSSLSAVEANTKIGEWHRSHEQVLEASGIPWTFLRPGEFMVNNLRWAPAVKAQGVVYMPESNKRTLTIDTDDIGAVGAAVLVKPGHAGKAYALTGEEELSGAERVAILGRVIGKALRCIDVSHAAAREGMLKGGMPPVLADAVAELMASRWDEADPEARRNIRRLTGQAPGTYEAWCRRHSKDFTGS